MNELNHRDDNGQLSEGIESNIDLDATMGSEIVRTEHKNGTENSQNLTANENLSASEKEDAESLDSALIADSGLFLIDQNKNNIDAVSVVQSVGHILRRARMAKGMSIDDVSRQLRLSPQQIEAIEKEDFEKLPGRTFLRGFIRNYANFVQLDPIPLMQLLPDSAPVISTYERTPFKNKQISFASSRESSGNNRLIIVIVLFVMILGAYFVFENNNKKSDNTFVNNEVKTNTEKTSVEIQLPLSATVKNATNIQTNKISETNGPVNSGKHLEVGSDIKTEIITTPAEKKPVIRETEKPAIISSDSGNLYFKFTADSWVRVVDGKGVSLFEQIKKGGSEQMIIGKRPLSIVIGNASGVSLTYNDTEIDVSSYRKQDGTARFTLK